MSPEQLLNLLNSTQSKTSIFTVIGKAISRGELEWANSLTPGDTIHEKIYLHYISQVHTVPTCEFCHSRTPFIGFSRGFKKFCNKSCSGKYTQLMKGDLIKSKSQATLFQRYGVSSPLQLETSTNNHQLTMELRRGVPLSPEHKQAILTGVRKKYGVDNVSQASEVRDKITQTMVDRYGTYYVGSAEAVKRRHDAWVESRLKKLEKVDSIKLLEKYTHSKLTYRALCLTCQGEFETALMDGTVRRCPTCFFTPANRSLKEEELSYIIRDLGFTVETNVKRKSLIYPYSLDIWVPEINVAFEFNGDYWHSDKFKDKLYHRLKFDMCTERGIKLIQIFEHEFDQKRDRVLGRIKSICGKNEFRVGARSLAIVTVDRETEEDFLEKNHLQGYVRSSTCLGLSAGNEILAVMSFGRPRFTKSADIELIRFATKLNHTVTGAGSKLLSAAQKLYAGKLLISYCDLRWSNGEFYKKLGFNLSHISAPGYIYVKKNLIVSRYAAQKDKLSKLLDAFDPNLTEGENMTRAGFLTLWDCGQFVFKKIL